MSSFNTTSAYDVTTLGDIFTAMNTTMKTRGKTSVVPAVMLFVFGVVGNVLALVILVRSSKRHQWRLFYRLVAALAVSDFIGTAGPLPVILATYANNRTWAGGDATCSFVSFCFIFAGMASATFAATMTVDRFMAVWFPIFYSSVVTRKTANILIPCIWGLSLTMAVLPLIGVNEHVFHYPNTWCFFNYYSISTADQGYSYFYAFMGVLFITLMIVLNLMVIVRLIMRCRQKQRPRSGSVSTIKRSKSSLVNDAYNIFFLVVLTTVFTICWLPLMIRIFVNQSTYGMEMSDYKANLKAIHLAVTNTTVDPWIYIVLRKDFLIRLYRIITCKGWKRELDSSSAKYSNDNCIVETKASSLSNDCVERLT